ncbi:MAG: hypothetical protein JAY90_21575 [Candidatus Thiodiazotropha lotti]|nr:hypothetical protein [Candidatus Thiodiazotropha lotti]
MFAVDICAYAVMHNHTHIVFKIDWEKTLAWCSDEVVIQWTTLYKSSPNVERNMSGFKLTKAEKKVVAEDVEKWRHRL